MRVSEMRPAQVLHAMWAGNAGKFPGGRLLPYAGRTSIGTYRRAMREKSEGCKIVAIVVTEPAEGESEPAMQAMVSFGELKGVSLLSPKLERRAKQVAMRRRRATSENVQSPRSQDKHLRLGIGLPRNAAHLVVAALIDE